jgi:hypothetical protein
MFCVTAEKFARAISARNVDASQHTERTVLMLDMCMSTCEQLNKDCKVEGCGIRQLISMYSQNRKHAPCKKCRTYYISMKVTSHTRLRWSNS